MMRRLTNRWTATTALVLALIMGIAAVPTAQAATGRTAPALKISASPSRVGGSPLAGQSWNGLGYIYVAGARIIEVSFALDGTTPEAATTEAPWDFAGTETTGAAKPLDSSTLETGEHQVTARIKMHGGGVRTLRATFEIIPEESTPDEAADAGISAPLDESNPDTGSEPSPDAPPPTASTPSQTQDTSGLHNVAHWQKEYDDSFPREDAEATKLSTSGDSWDQYGLAYHVDGAVSMFQATGNTKYLDQALKYTNNVIATAKTSSSLSASDWRDGYLGWSSVQNLDPGEQPNEFPLYESYLWRYVTNMLVAMKQSSTVMANVKYKTQYAKVLSFTEKNVFDKWYNRGADDHVYRENAHMASHWAMISMDLSLTTTDTARKAKAKVVHTNINDGMPNYAGGSLHKLMRKQSDGSYVFFGDFDGKSNRLEDVSHGNAVVAYVAHANALGLSWTDADMAAFTTTLTKRIWPSKTKYAELVDGSGTDNGWFSDGWIDLGRFDANLQKRLESHEVGQGAQLFGSLALNAKLLGVK